MSTHACIAYLDSDGKYHSTYCHNDGYPEGLGQQLVDWMAGQSVERRKKVMDKILAEKIGWSSLLKTNIDLEPGWDQGTLWYEKDPATCPPQSYTARGETDELQGIYDNLERIKEETDPSYIYVVSSDYELMEVWYTREMKLLGTFQLDAVFDLDSAVVEE